MVQPGYCLPGSSQRQRESDQAEAGTTQLVEVSVPSNTGGLSCVPWLLPWKLHSSHISQSKFDSI